jgi:hypothetical protein
MTAQEVEFVEALERQMRFDFSADGDLARRKSGLLWFRSIEVYYKRVSRTKLVYEVGQLRKELAL